MDKRSFTLTVSPDYFEVIGVAILRNFRLAFTLYSGIRNGGVADVIQSPGDYVEGVLYDLHPEALALLDEREGVGIGLYERQNIIVECKNEKVEAMTYTVVSKSGEEIPPSQEYTQLIYNGAVDYLSFSYRKKLIKSWDKKFGIHYFAHLERGNR